MEVDVGKFDLNQVPSITEMKFVVHRPTIIVKDRPYFERYLEIDLGEINISSRNSKETGRFKDYPDKIVLTKSMIIEAKELGIKFQPEKFPLS